MTNLDVKCHPFSLAFGLYTSDTFSVHIKTIKWDWGRASSEIWGRETAEQNSVSVTIKNKQKTLVRLGKAHQAFFKTFITFIWTAPGPSSLGRCECFGAGKVIRKGCASLSKPTEHLWLRKAIKTLKPLRSLAQTSRSLIWYWGKAANCIYRPWNHRPRPLGVLDRPRPLAWLTDHAHLHDWQVR